MIRRTFITFVLLLVQLGFCFATFAQQKTSISLIINPNVQYQVIEGFGASDAWTCQFAGNWPDAKRRQMADWLFSTKDDSNGQPLGIGLSIWRFSIGAGSAQQGAQSDIRDEWRRQYAFLAPQGTYDWEAMPGQVWFLKAAKERGVKQFLGFVNSPNVRFTLNSKAYSSDGKCILDFAKLNDFTADLANTVEGLQKRTGILLNYISPINEPQWKWSDHGQEGCPYTNEEMARVLKALNATLENRHLPTKIQVGEAGQLDYLYSAADTAKGSQIKKFFNTESPYYLGNLSHVDRSISAHSYFTTSPEKRAVAARQEVAKQVAAVPGLRYWMSEYCILGDSLMKGEKRDLGMAPALFIANLIYKDLAISNATSWQWWLAVSPSDYKDGLVYIDKNKADGNIYDSKMLWALGNYSRFITPGSVRIKANLKDAENVFVSSYVRKDKKLVSVIVNGSANSVVLSVKSPKGNLKNLKAYVTSDKQSLTPQKLLKNTNEVNIPALSVVTLVSN